MCLKRVFFLIATINFIFSTLNAQVVTNGLLLYVNAGNSTSYPGNGSKWFDLSGQNFNVYQFNLDGVTYTEDADEDKTYFKAARDRINKTN